MSPRRLASLLVAVLLALAVPRCSPAAVLEGIVIPRGEWESCAAACTAGVRTNYLRANGATIVRLRCVTSGTATFTIHACLEGSPAACDAASSWVVTTVAGTGCTGLFTFTRPVGFYRLSVDSCTACTYRFLYGTNVWAGR